MKNRRLPQVLAVVCALGVSAAALTPTLADAHATATAAKAKHHKKHHKRHHKRKKSVIKGSAPPSYQGSAESAVGDFTGAGVFHAMFSANRPANSPQTSATGTFTATMPGGGTVSGPVTCLDVEGNTMELFYPITSASPSALMDTMKGIYFSAQLGSNGQPTKFGFEPSESSTATSCNAPFLPFPVTSGTLSLSS